MYNHEHPIVAKIIKYITIIVRHVNINKYSHMINRMLFKQKSNYSKIDQLRYLSQSALIEESVAPHVVRTTLIMVSIIILSLIVWSGLTQVEEISISQGDVIPSQRLQSIQHLEGGIVKEIKVNDGQLVEAGQVLITLEGKNATQDYEALKSREIALQLDANRLRAFIDKRQPNFDDVTIDEKHIALKDEEMKSYNSMIDAMESEKKVLNEQIDQKKDSLTMLEKRKASLESKLVLVQQEKDLKEQLAEKGNLSKFKYIEIQKELSDVENNLNETMSSIEQAKDALEEFQERTISLEKKYNEDAYRQLNAIDMELSQVLETVKKLESQVNRLEIKSPLDGFVKGLKVNTIGGVIEPGQIIMQIVPIEGPLVVEIKINPRDIGHIKIGQDVNVKISAYDFSRYGSVRGTLQYVSATTFVNEKEESFYMGKVALKQNYVGLDPKRNLIVPGMTVQAEIVTGSKSILAYLLKPIQTNIQTAFSER